MLIKTYCTLLLHGPVLQSAKIIRRENVRKNKYPRKKLVNSILIIYEYSAAELWYNLRNYCSLLSVVDAIYGRLDLTREIYRQILSRLSVIWRQKQMKQNLV